jgi:gas vesicle protein
MNDYERENSGGSPVMMFLAGAVVGAGMALLLAPASGEDTRRRLGQTAKRLREETRNRVGQARETLGNLKDDAMQAVESGREAFSKSRSQRPETETAR